MVFWAVFLAILLPKGQGKEGQGRVGLNLRQTELDAWGLAR